jgi:uncharacterized PurR-regulated membrane protein YhhQ (DUF165 family)
MEFFVDVLSKNYNFKNPPTWGLFYFKVIFIYKDFIYERFDKK